MTKLSIPDIILDGDIATLAKKGAGKTYLNKGLVERLLDAKRRVVIMDPLNVWYGLKAMADGSPGYPVIVVGGPNADLPLDPTKGRELGEYVAGADIRLVVDVSELRRGQIVSFSRDFFAELYRLNRDPLWMVLEEADVFAPQNPEGAESFMLHEVDMIARRGRQRGFRLWTICQRPQQLNKKALSQTATMFLLRLMAPQDRKAAEEWLMAHTDKAEALRISLALPKLQVGHGYLLSPENGILKEMQFPLIKTYDTSATPKPGENRPNAVLAKPDVGALQKALTAQEAPGAASTVSAPQTTADPGDGSRWLTPLEIDAIKAEAFTAGMVYRTEEFQDIFGDIGKAVRDIVQQTTALEESMGEAKDLLADAIPPDVLPAARNPRSQLTLVKDTTIGIVPTRDQQPMRRQVTPFVKGEQKISKAVRDVITTLERMYPVALPFKTAAKHAGVGLKSSAFRTYEPELLALDVVDVLPDGRLRGRVKLDTGVPVLDGIASQLSPAYQAILQAIRDNRLGITKERIIELAGISPTSSTTGAALKALLDLHLIQKNLDGSYAMALEFQ